MTKPGLPVVNADGTKWRMAPGPYWKQGMQNGYQDVGTSWTFFERHTMPTKRPPPG